jgi:hypothetical protein
VEEQTCSLHHKPESKERKKGASSHDLLQGHPSNDLKTSHLHPPFKGFTTFQGYYSEDQDFNTWAFVRQLIIPIDAFQKLLDGLLHV